jgi:hypothetical protein
VWACLSALSDQLTPFFRKLGSGDLFSFQTASLESEQKGKEETAELICRCSKRICISNFPPCHGGLRLHAAKPGRNKDMEEISTWS